MSVTVQNLTKIYGSQKAVDEISFQAKAGEVLGFLGPNGAGKTTTMKIVTSFIPPDEGTATVCGFDVLKEPMEVRRRIGYLPEHNPLYLDLYVREYLDMVARIHSENHISRKQYSSGDASLNTLRVKPDSIWKERLSLTDRYRMHRWAGALLMELGYAGSDWWASSPTDRMWVRFRSFLWRIGRGFQGGVQSWKLASVDPFEPLRAWRRS